MTAARIVLVPGFWLGAWAWEEVASRLRADGHSVTALTLPGLESGERDRANITLEDHVDAICDAINAESQPVVLVVHSGASIPGYAASDRIPERIAAMVYVDTGPSNGAINPRFEGAEWALPSWEELEADGNSREGLSAEQLETFRRRAIPQPGATVREAPALNNDARLDVPSVIICTSMPSDALKGAAEQGAPWAAALGALRTVRYVDLPTSHWPMWSRPRELTEIIAEAARDAGPEG